MLFTSEPAPERRGAAGVTVATRAGGLPEMLPVLYATPRMRTRDIACAVATDRALSHAAARAT